MKNEDNDAKDQAKVQYESICEILAALDVDYDRLEELEDSEDLCEDDIAELVRLREAAGDCTSQDEAQERLYESPLSVQVRSGWEDPGVGLTAYEFEILLCCGGPAVRIRGELDEHMQPDCAYMEFQGWFQPWVKFHDADEATLLAYANQFSYGS